MRVRLLPPADDESLATGVENHCPICGSRFVGRRIPLTFDLDHGAASPTRISVLKDQRRLRRRKIALRVTCANLVAEGVDPSVGVAFERAACRRTRTSARRGSA
jgi:hypothetical protein